MFAFFSFRKNANNAKLISFSILLILFAGLRSSDSVMDYDNYLDYYNWGSENIEPTFTIISTIVKYLFDNYIFLFITYAIIGVSLKALSIKQLSQLSIFSLAIYVSNFFILHEMTQIRVGVASGLLLLSIKPLFERNWKKFLIICIFASMFHYTAVVIAPLYFLNPKKITKLFWIAIIPFAYLIHFLGINLTSFIGLIPIHGIERLWDIYSSEIDIDQINVFNSVQVLRCLISMYLLFFTDKIVERNKYFPILIKIYVVGIAVFVMFIDMPVISFRISEIFYIVEIILIPFIFYTFNEKRIGYLIPFIIGLFFLYYNLVYIQLIA